MAVNLVEPDFLLEIAGARWATTGAAIKSAQRDDLALLVLDPGTRVAGVFTRNAFAAAPVFVAKKHLAKTMPRALLVNSGNANAGTGQQGEVDARACCAHVAESVGLATEEVLPFSTGVIGQRLPMDRILGALPHLRDQLAEDGWLSAARAIMTTDTRAKGVSRTVRTAGGLVTLTGIAKGSGMIHPDMATMLSFVATDAAVSAADLDDALHAAVSASFNSITVDGDTSTNDSAILCATGRGPALDSGDGDWPAFVAALTDLMQKLACAIVRDAEGATRFITLNVNNATSIEEARQVAFTIAHSPLFKTAAFAGDPNWGRILAAIGRSGIEDLSVDTVDIAVGDVVIVAGGQPKDDYLEADAAAVMSQPEFSVNVNLGRGSVDATIWTSDLSYEYVRINAEYRS